MIVIFPRTTRHVRICCKMVIILAVATLASCSSPSRKAAVPIELADQAMVMNDPKMRTWDDSLNAPFWEELVRASKMEMLLRTQAGENGPMSHANFLAISGGGADGAYGAGLLCGWTAAGTRPEFKMVTGISTGALTAPFAFLGPAYDEKLAKVYRTVNTDQIATSRFYIAALFNDALMDTLPLRSLLKSLVDETMMKDIAKEYARGRVLLVETTNLDANRGVIWNIGAIAASGDPHALELIHDILIASAAIPAAFPPVMIDVMADGKPYQEMHVDGGTKAQVFLYPPSLALRARAAAEGLNRERVAYIIRNARLDPDWAQTQRRTLSIAARAISSLIATQGVGDLFRLYLITQRDGVDFNLAYIPATFKVKATEDFDPVYMSQLFDVGYKAATASGGYVWEKKPPGYADVEGSPSAPATGAR